MENTLDLTNSNLLGDEFSYVSGKEKRKEKREKRKEKRKKRITKLKEKVGKVGKRFRNRFRGILRKGVLKNLKRNVHGMATRLYPAVAPADAVAKARYKKAYVAKSKNIYSNLLKRWKKMGGEEKDLVDAIMTGSKKGFFKVRKGAMGKSKSSGADGYSNLTDESLLNGLTNMSLLNATGSDSDYFYGVISPDVSVYYGEDGSETSEEEGVTDEEKNVEEIPDQQEVQKAHKGFWAWLKGLFKKNKADENPFEADAADAKKFADDSKEDEKNLPADEEANNETVTELDKNDTADDAGGATDDSKGYEKTSGDDYTGEDSGKILGIPKTAFWIGVGVLALVGGILVYRKMRGK